MRGRIRGLSWGMGVRVFGCITGVLGPRLTLMSHRVKLERKVMRVPR